MGENRRNREFVETVANLIVTETHAATMLQSLKERAQGLVARTGDGCAVETDTSNRFYQVCPECKGMGKVSGYLTDDRQRFTAHKCQHPACERGIIINMEGFLVLEFLEALMEREFRPFNHQYGKLFLLLKKWGWLGLKEEQKCG